MGLLGKLFSSKPDFPDIDPSSPAAMRVAGVERELSNLASEVRARLEVVPTGEATYVFIGKPPKEFGLAWIHDGKVSGLNTLVKEHGLKTSEMGSVVEQLRAAYQRNMDVNRYTAKVQGVSVVVTPSDSLAQEVHGIIDGILKH
jgi:ABC-type xylose transport system substrate-binding protein